MNVLAAGFYSLLWEIPRNWEISVLFVFMLAMPILIVSVQDVMLAHVRMFSLHHKVDVPWFSRVVLAIS